MWDRTLGSAIKNNRKKGLSSYMDEYELLNMFQRFALDYKICTLLLHHTRKAKAENRFDEISGTRGISGAADANFILQRNKYNGELFIQGRDLEDAKYELELDKEYLTWHFKGISNSIKLTPEQEIILDVFNKDYGKELKPSEIAKILDKEDTNIRPTIGKLLTMGLLEQNAYGKYKLVPIN
jgi:RecA-family ATPase